MIPNENYKGQGQNWPPQGYIKEFVKQPQVKSKTDFYSSVPFFLLSTLKNLLLYQSSLSWLTKPETIWSTKSVSINHIHLLLLSVYIHSPQSIAFIPQMMLKLFYSPTLPQIQTFTLTHLNLFHFASTAFLPQTIFHTQGKILCKTQIWRLKLFKSTTKKINKQKILFLGLLMFHTVTDF